MKQSLLFAASLLLLTSCGKADKKIEPEKVAVRTEKAQAHQFYDGVATQGVVETVDQAVLSTQIAGTLEELKLKEGDRVKKGDVLFRSDRKNLENRCVLAEEALKMAQERVRTHQANLEIAKVSYDKAEIDYKRADTLFKSNAVSKNAFESAELKYRSALLAIRQAEASVATARSEVSFASATLEIARKKLADSIVSAPYDGVITAKLRHENEFCNAGTPVLKIESFGKKRITAALSAVRHPSFAVGKTVAAVSFRGRKLCRVPVTIVSPAVDPASRTFEVKADLPSDFALPSGTLCDVSFIFGERENLSVPEEVVLFRQNGKFALFSAVNGKAKEIEIRPGLTLDGKTEILNGEAIRGLEIIVSGHYFVNDGTPVVVGEK